MSSVTREAGFVHNRSLVGRKADVCEGVRFVR